MAEEYFGVFSSETEAANAEKALIDAGFTQGQIQVRHRNESVYGSQLEGLNNYQALLVVTTQDVAEQKNALEIMQQCGATDIWERNASGHSSIIKPEPDRIEPASNADAERMMS